MPKIYIKKRPGACQLYARAMKMMVMMARPQRFFSVLKEIHTVDGLKKRTSNPGGGLPFFRTLGPGASGPGDRDLFDHL